MNELEAQSSRTLTWRTAVVLHMCALAALMGSVLLPDAPGDFLIALSPVLLWLPLLYLGKGKTAQMLRCLFVAGICIYTATSNQLQEIPRFSDEGTLTVLALGLSWMALVLCVPGGVTFAAPLGLLTCVTAAVRIEPAAERYAVLPGVSAAALLLSGALFFIDGLKHPARGRSAFARALAWRFSPHIVLGLLAALLMLSTAKLLRAPVSWLSARLPDGNSDSRTFALSRRPPSFKGCTMYRVRSRRGPVPAYLAERYYVNYHAGTWLQGVSCYTSESYGAKAPDAVRNKLPTCEIFDIARDGPLPVPVGVLKPRMRRGRSVLRGEPGSRDEGAAAEIFTWDARGIPCQEAGKDIDDPLPLDLKRLSELSQTVCQGATTDLGKSMRITSYLMRNTSYDLSKPFESGMTMDPVEEFLFVSRSGWCVHLATASALMLRSVGVPTRFVIGYALSGSRTHDVEVLDSHGHAWCEARVETANGPRWLVVDPSPPPIHGEGVASVGRFRTVASICLLACGVVIVVRSILKVDTSRLRMDIREDALRSQPDMVAAVYERVVDSLTQKGVEYGHHMTPREYALEVVPAACRNDMLTVAAAFEDVFYRGFVALGRQRIESLVRAQEHLLRARIRCGKRPVKDYIANRNLTLRNGV